MGDIEPREQEFGAQHRIRAQRREAAIMGELLGREVPVRRHCGCAKVAIARQRKEPLVVDGRHQDVTQRVAQGSELVVQHPAAIAQHETQLDQVLDRFDVGHQRRAPVLDPNRARRVILGLTQGVQIRLQSVPTLGDAFHCPGELVRIHGGNQARGGGDDGAALSGDGEGGRQRRDALAIHPALHVTHAVEGKPSHEGSHKRERDGAADPQIELGGEAVQPQPGDHGVIASTSVSTG